MSQRRYGHSLRVADAFCGMGSIPFEAARLGCEVSASDLNPVACLLTWGALNIVGAKKTFHGKVLQAQKQIFERVDRWYEKSGLETSDEGWRAALYFYCAEISVPEWDGWKIPIAGTWHVAPKMGAWIDLIPDVVAKRFEFKVRYLGEGFREAKKGTKQDSEIVCPEALWELLHSQGKTENTQKRLNLPNLIQNFGGLRNWEKSDARPREGDFYGERMYCIRWLKPAEVDAAGIRHGRDTFVYREPTPTDISKEDEIIENIETNLSSLQSSGWVPDWRIQAGSETTRLTRERGWTHWHHLFNPRQLLMLAKYSEEVASLPRELRIATTLNIGLLANYNARLCHWHETAGGGVGSVGRVFYNQALNTFFNYPSRSFASLTKNLIAKHVSAPAISEATVEIANAREVTNEADLWITDPPYADAVNYEELSEFFLAWYKPHIKSCFPEWYTDSKRSEAVKGDDADFRVSMAECYTNLASRMPDDGIHLLMFTHKDTDVWEDLALIMWSAGLQVKQVWSVATETGAGAVKDGNYVQATYNMVLRKRPADAPMGFDDIIVDQIKARVTEVITHMRNSQLEAGPLSCGYTDTDYLLAAQAVAAEVVTGYSTISGIDLDEELRTPNRERNPDSALRVLMTLAKREAVEFLVPQGLEEHLRRTSDATTAHTFWRHLVPEEKFLLKGLELEKGGEDRIGTFQDLGRAYGIADYDDLLGPVVANNARTQLPTEFGRPDMTRWEDVSASDRDSFSHSVTRHLYYAISLLAGGADSERAVKHLVDCTNFWEDRYGKHLVLLGYLYQTTEPIEAWSELRPIVQTLRLAVENHRA